MQQRRLKTTAFVIGCFVLNSLSAQTFIVKEKGGKQTNYAVSEINTISFAGEVLMVKKKDGTVPNYTLLSLQLVDFSGTYSAVNSIRQSEQFSVYPNPVRDVLKLTISYASTSKTEITILTLDGKVVYNRILHPTVDSNTVSIQLSDFAKGVYICQLKNAETNSTTKLIKE